MDTTRKPNAMTAKNDMDSLYDILSTVDFELLARDGFHRKKNFNDIVIVAYVHCLDSIIPFVDIILREMRIPPFRLIILPKPYSLIAAVKERLKKRKVTLIEASNDFQPGHFDERMFTFIDEANDYGLREAERIESEGRRPRIILLDDGGFLTRRYFSRQWREGQEIVSIQHTSSGIERRPVPIAVPKINVAKSYAKQEFESKIIAKGVLREMPKLDRVAEAHNIGILGYGAIGRALGKESKKEGKKIWVFDHVMHSSVTVHNKADVLHHADVIFGCSGRNSLWANEIETLDDQKTFISCSSRDVEFQNCIQKCFKRFVDNDRPYGEIVLEGKVEQRVLNGGFPINFDRTKEWETPGEIALTRGLMLIGVFQSLCIDVRARWRATVKLSPIAQKELVKYWHSHYQEAKEYVVEEWDEYEEKWDSLSHGTITPLP